MKKTIWIITIILIVSAFILRFYRFENNASFDWDQNRDYSEVQKIASGKYVVLGPVAKGNGGFYLGSLYYYLLLPAYTLMNHSLYALPITSIVLDSLFVGLIYLLLHQIIGKKNAFIISLIWLVSWIMIGASRISWNVALVPLWSLFTLYSMYKVIQDRSIGHFYILGLLLGLTLHIHVAIIPVIPLFALIYRHSLKFNLKSWLLMFVFMFIPVIPLIAFDLKHGFLNAHLLRDQLGTQAMSRKGLWLMLNMSIIKLGKVVSGIFFARFVDNFYLGVLTIILAIHSAIFDKKLLVKIAGQTILIATILILALGDYGFPEYYYAGAYLSILLLYISKISFLPKIIPFTLVGLVIYLNLSNYTTEPSRFSLKYKYDIVNTLKSISEPIDLSYQFDPGRDGGFRYIVAQAGIKLDPSSKMKVLLTDKLKTSLYINGELTRDLAEIGNFKTALYIVQ